MLFVCGCVCLCMCVYACAWIHLRACMLTFKHAPFGACFVVSLLVQRHACSQMHVSCFAKQVCDSHKSLTHRIEVATHQDITAGTEEATVQTNSWDIDHKEPDCSLVALVYEL